MVAPPATRGGGASVVVKRGSGVTVVSGGGTGEGAGAGAEAAGWEAVADVPVDVEVLQFDARRDLDARGRRVMGVGVRKDVSEDGEWLFARASLEGFIDDLCVPAATPAVAVSASGSLDAACMPAMGGGLVQQQLRLQEEEPDVFGDRHCYGDDDADDGDDDDDDIDDDASLEGDSGTDMEVDGDDD